MRRTPSSPGSPEAKRPWLESSCHRLKHEPGAARQLIRDLRRMAAEKGVSPDQPEVAAAITYFTNQSKAVVSQVS